MTTKSSRAELEPQADGRRARSDRSRAKIVAAMLDLVGAGNVSPNAAEVAAAAGVGLRTVFRHFDDMDSLYREISDDIEARVLPIVFQPVKGATWRDRARDLAERRCRVFETILPYRISAECKRFDSPFLMQDYKRMTRLERVSLESAFPAKILKNATLFSALQAALGFQIWRALRTEQELGVDAARATVLHLVDAILAGAEA
ncbi:MAG: TetR family transcriptional regulator [Hyphomicrobiales bacterium]|nr:TetR family transcriptional regulator [Hyphomicrobiales bacterium]